MGTMKFNLLFIATIAAVLTASFLLVDQLLDVPLFGLALIFSWLMGVMTR